jgi:hypothetical protein
MEHFRFGFHFVTYLLKRKRAQQPEQSFRCVENPFPAHSRLMLEGKLMHDCSDIVHLNGVTVLFGGCDYLLQLCFYL